MVEAIGKTRLDPDGRDAETFAFGTRVLVVPIERCPGRIESARGQR